MGDSAGASEKCWSWAGLNYNPNITLEFVQANPEKHWNWDALSWNPNITWEIVQAHPEKNWDWYGLSENPNITWEIVQAHPEKEWIWRELSCNTQVKARSQFIISRLHRVRVIHYIGFRLPSHVVRFSAVLG